MLQNPDPIKYDTKTKSQYHEIAPHKLRKGREDNFDVKALQNENKYYGRLCVLYTGFEVLGIFYFPLH